MSNAILKTSQSQGVYNAILPHDPSRPNLRSADEHLLKQKTTRTVDGDRAFSNAAPALWNFFPDDLLMIDNLSHFQTALKTHLFKKAFPES